MKTAQWSALNLNYQGTQTGSCFIVNLPVHFNFFLIDVRMILAGLIEDTENYRAAIASLLGLSGEVQLAGSWRDAESAIKEVPEILPDVILTDIQLPGLNGIECIRRLKIDCPNIQFLVLTVFEEDEKIFEALKAGASGYLLKSSSPEIIINAIKEVHNGGSPMS